MSNDRSFGADRHDLRSHLLDAEREAKGLISRAAQAARRILRRAPEEQSNGAALSRVAGGAARRLDADLRSYRSRPPVAVHPQATHRRTPFRRPR